MPTSYTFCLPIDDTVGPVTDYWGHTPADADPSMLKLFAHYKPGPRGRNVFRMNDDTITENQPPNWDGTQFFGVGPNVSTQQPYAYSYTYAGGSQPANGVTTFTLPPNEQVKRIYWGGTCQGIDATERTLLINAGYEGYITPGSLVPETQLHPAIDLYPRP